MLQSFLDPDEPRTVIAANLIRGSTAEAPISNKEFLNSYLDYGVWLRALSAQVALNVLADAQSSQVMRISAIATFYQSMGQAIEDIYANLIAWSVWSQQPEALIADLLARTSLRLSTPPQSLGGGYCDEVRVVLLQGSKRADIYPREYVLSLLETHGSSLPQQFGIPWKRNPSVKLVPKALEQQWNNLPNQLRELLPLLVSRNGHLIAACYNKLKHGPQLVVQELVSVASHRGLPVSDTEGAYRPAIRLLMKGARTQETEQEATNGVPVAPAVLDDVPNLTRFLFHEVMRNVIVMSVLGTWLYNVIHPESRRDFGSRDAQVRSLTVHTEEMWKRLT